MQLDYESHTPRGTKTPNAIKIFLMKPVGRVTLITYFALWIGWTIYARLPPTYPTDVFGAAILAAFVSAPLIARVWIRHVLCRSELDYRFSKLLRATTGFAMVFPLMLLLKIPMQIGFTLSLPAMNSVRQWAQLHPGGQLPPQMIGVYWAEGITATPDGVRFRVCGSPGVYGSRSGFASGSTVDEVKTADVYATWDPVWNAWGWDY